MTPSAFADVSGANGKLLCCHSAEALAAGGGAEQRLMAAPGELEREVAVLEQ